MGKKILPNNIKELVAGAGVNSLPDNPSRNGYTAREIKNAIARPSSLLANWLDSVSEHLGSNETIAVFAELPSATGYDDGTVAFLRADNKLQPYLKVSGEWVKIGDDLGGYADDIDDLKALFTDGSAKKAIADQYGNNIASTYETKSDATSKHALEPKLASNNTFTGNNYFNGVTNFGGAITVDEIHSNDSSEFSITIGTGSDTVSTYKLPYEDDEGQYHIAVKEDLTGGAYAVAKATKDGDGNTISSTYVKVADVVNALNSTSETKPLSAAKGKALNDAITAIQTLLSSNDTDLDTLQEVVTYIKSNKSLIEGITTSKVNVSDIIDALDSTADNKPLSAKQGKVLKGLVDAKADPIVKDTNVDSGTIDTLVGFDSSGNLVYGNPPSISDYVKFVGTIDPATLTIAQLYALVGTAPFVYRVSDAGRNYIGAFFLPAGSNQALYYLEIESLSDKARWEAEVYTNVTQDSTTINGFTSNANYNPYVTMTYLAHAWEDSTSYDVGDMISYSGKLYRCKTAHTSSSSNLTTTYWEEYDILDDKQDKLTFDSTPTENSGNPVTSGGVFSALAQKQNTLTFDNSPTSSSNNPVKSGGVYTALAGKQDTIDSSHKLSSDLVDDTNNTHLFVSSTEKETWNAKQDAISNLSTIASGAALGATAVQPGDLKTVATSGSYDDLTDKPTIPSAVTVDSAMSSSSENPVQNKVVNTALAGKADLVNGKVPSSQLPSYVDDVVLFDGTVKNIDSANVPIITEANLEAIDSPSDVETAFGFSLTGVGGYNFYALAFVYNGDTWSGSGHTLYYADLYVIMGTYSNMGSNPTVGIDFDNAKVIEESKIYIDPNSNKTYRASYIKANHQDDSSTASVTNGLVEISKSLAIGTTSGTAYDGASGASLASSLSDVQAQLGNIPFGGVYAENTVYDAGDLVWYDNKLYRALNDISQAPATFDSTDWEEVTLDELLAEKQDDLTFNPTVPSGTTPTSLTGIKDGSNYYSIPQGSPDAIEVVEFQTTTPLTSAQIAKAEAGKLAVIKSKALFVLKSYSSSEIVFRRISAESANGSYFPKKTAISYEEIKINKSTGYLQTALESTFSAVLDNANNVFDYTTLPTSNGTKIVRELNLYCTQLMMANNFSTSATYSVGDFAIYQNELYKCHTAVSTAGSWTGTTNWTKTNIVDSIPHSAFNDLGELAGTTTIAELYALAGDYPFAFKYGTRYYAGFIRNAATNTYYIEVECLDDDDRFVDSSTSGLPSTTLSTFLNTSGTYNKKYALASSLDSKQDSLPSISGNGGKVLKVNSGATGLEWGTVTLPPMGTAYGSYDVAVGDTSVAGASGQNYYATAYGYNAQATSAYSTAIGYHSNAAAVYATAIGGATANGSYSTALGYGSYAGGGASTALGYYAYTKISNTASFYGYNFNNAQDYSSTLLVKDPSHIFFANQNATSTTNNYTALSSFTSGKYLADYLMEANPTVPSGTTPTSLTGLKVGLGSSSTYYSLGGMSNPMTTAEDIIVGGSSGTPARLAKGNNGELLRVNSSGSLAYGKNLPIIDCTGNNPTYPSSANTDGLIIVICSSEPSTKYSGYLYLVAPSSSN